MGLDVNGLTLAEIEALAERLGAAAKTIRDAQSLLGGGQPREFSPASAALVAAQPRPVIVPGAPNPLLTAAENAERQRLIKLNTMGPDDIEAMERTS